METLENGMFKNLDELHSEELVRNIPLLTYLLILCLFGITGNCLVLYIFIKIYTQSTFRLFVIFLSAVDLFTSSVAIPLEMSTLILEYKIDINWLCKLYIVIITWPTITSIFLLLAIATDRYRKVCAPFSWQVSFKAAKIIFIFSAFLSILLSIMRLIMFGARATEHKVFNITIIECEVEANMTKTPLPLINNTIFALLFVGAITGVTVLYSCIAFRVKQQIKRKNEIVGRVANHKKAENIEEESQNESERKQSNHPGLDNEASTSRPTRDPGSTHKCRAKKQSSTEKGVKLKDTKPPTKSDVSTRKQQNRTTLVMFMVSSVFFVSFLPSVSLILTRALVKDFVESLSDFERSVYKFIMRFYLHNCVINPVIYGIFDPYFRKSCKTLVSSCRST